MVVVSERKNKAGEMDRGRRRVPPFFSCHPRPHSQPPNLGSFAAARRGGQLEIHGERARVGVLFLGHERARRRHRKGAHSSSPHPPPFFSFVCVCPAITFTLAFRDHKKRTATTHTHTHTQRHTPKKTHCTKRETSLVPLWSSLSLFVSSFRGRGARERRGV